MDFPDYYIEVNKLYNRQLIVIKLADEITFKLTTNVIQYFLCKIIVFY